MKLLFTIIVSILLTACTSNKLYLAADRYQDEALMMTEREANELDFVIFREVNELDIELKTFRRYKKGLN